MVSHLFLMSLTLEHREFKHLKVRQADQRLGCRFRLSSHPSEDILTQSYGMPNLRLTCQVNSWKHGLALLIASRLLKPDLEGEPSGKERTQ